MRSNQIKTFCLSLILIFGLIATARSQTVSLNGDWNLSYWAQPESAITSPEAMEGIKTESIAAKVPGNVELDLLAAGLICDPMIGNNVNDLRKWEGHQWCYTKRFDSPKLKSGQRAELQFGGIDCLADIWLNGVHVGCADNMLIEQVYDVTGTLKSSGENLLQVIIRSAVMEGQNHLLGSVSIGNFPSEESVFIRKAPHGYGWDIMPRLVSAGLWRDVDLKVVNSVRLVDVNWMVPEVDTTNHIARIFTDIQLKIPFEKFGKVKAVVTMNRKGREVYRGEISVLVPAFRHIIELKDADLWWPRGYGEAALYDTKVELVDVDGTVLSSQSERVGLRTIKLDISDINLPDSPGRFCFIVNGERVFIHGTNWVPMDALHSRDASQIDNAVEMAVDLNCNMIRCWGGNVYEDHHFFDLCDQNGIMVWQDFTMGCTVYPQREEFTKRLEKEVISVVMKLRSHPSLVIWSGNNENDCAFQWSMKPYGINPNLDKVSRQVISSVLFEFDPTRPYLPSSPYYSQAVWEHGSGDEVLPENHLWGPRGYYKDPFYTEPACCFVSEIGYHGCPNVESLKKMMTKDAVYPWTRNHEWNDEWVTKSVRRFADWGKTYDRNNLMLNQVTIMFGEVPNRLEDFALASQIVQAEAMKFFVEMWRGNKFEGRNGIIWWNLRDGWPVISDAIVDYYNSKKLAYYFMKSVQKDVCVMINDPVNGAYPLVAVNDTRTAQKVKVTVTDVATGKKVYSGDASIPVNGKTLVASIPVIEGQGVLLISYQIGAQTLNNHYLYGKVPYNLKQYKTLLKKTGIYTIKE